MSEPVIVINQTWQVVALSVFTTCLVQFMIWAVVDITRSELARRRIKKQGKRIY